MKRKQFGIFVLVMVSVWGTTQTLLLADQNQEQSGFYSSIHLRSEEPSPTQYPAGTFVDWSVRRIYAMGRGQLDNGDSFAQKRLLATRAAQVDAYGKLAAFIYGIHLDKDTTIEKYGQNHNQVAERVEGVVQSAYRVGQPLISHDHQWVEVILALPLNQLELRLELSGQIVEQ